MVQLERRLHALARLRAGDADARGDGFVVALHFRRRKSHGLKLGIVEVCGRGSPCRSQSSFRERLDDLGILLFQGQETFRVARDVGTVAAGHAAAKPAFEAAGRNGREILPEEPPPLLGVGSARELEIFARRMRENRRLFTSRIEHHDVQPGFDDGKRRMGARRTAADDDHVNGCHCAGRRKVGIAGRMP